MKNKFFTSIYDPKLFMVPQLCQKNVICRYAWNMFQIASNQTSSIAVIYLIKNPYLYYVLNKMTFQHKCKAMDTSPVTRCQGLGLGQDVISIHTLYSCVCALV